MKIDSIGIIGCGTMGSGIAHVAARAGVRTVLVKRTPGDPGAVKKKIEGALRKEVEKGKLDLPGCERALQSLEVTADSARVSGCDLVVEAIVEELPAKQALFRELEGIVRPDAVLATNTSSLSVVAISEACARRERVVGMHFFGPVPAMALVEVISIHGTESPLALSCADFCRRLGKTPVVIGDSAGFIVNRLLVPYLLSAMSEWEKGLSNPHDIDTAMKLGCAHPMGPFALSDLIGLDIVLAMAESLLADSGEARFEPPAVLRRLVSLGHLGRKSKKGIYDYADPAAPSINAAARAA